MRVQTLLLAVAIASIALLSSKPITAAVIISEIMYEAGGSDTGREWVEIFNAGSIEVDLEGWRLHDEDAGSQPGALIPAGTLLAPNQALVLIEDETTFTTEWGTGANRLVYPGMGTDLNMANAGTDIGDEVLQLVDAEDNIVDMVDYMNSAPFPAVTNDTATSIFLRPGFFTAGANDLGQNWGRSTVGLHGAVAALDDGPEAASPGSAVAIPEPSTLALLLMAIVPFGRFLVRG